jgi:hypothetical protein
MRKPNLGLFVILALLVPVAVLASSASLAETKLLLMHERCAGGNPGLIPILHEDILAAINKHVTVDADKAPTEDQAWRDGLSARNRY